MCRFILRKSRYLLDSRSLHTVNARATVANHGFVRSNSYNLANELQIGILLIK